MVVTHSEESAKDNYTEFSYDVLKECIITLLKDPRTDSTIEDEFGEGIKTSTSDEDILKLVE